MKVYKLQLVILIVMLALISVIFYVARINLFSTNQDLYDQLNILSTSENKLASAVTYYRYGIHEEEDFIDSEVKNLMWHSNRLSEDLKHTTDLSEQKIHYISVLLSSKLEAINKLREFSARLAADISYFRELQSKINTSNLSHDKKIKIAERLNTLINKVETFPMVDVGRNIILLEMELELRYRELTEVLPDQALTFDRQSKLLTENLRNISRVQNTIQTNNISEYLTELVAEQLARNELKNKISLGFFYFAYVISIALVICFFYLYMKNREQRSLVERKNRELSDEKGKIVSTLSSLSDGVIKLDPEGKILFMNSVAEKMTNSKGQSAKGCGLNEVLEIIDVTNNEKVDDIYQELKSRKDMSDQHKNYSLRGCNEQLYMVEMKYVQLVVDGESSNNAVLVIHDVSENHHLIKHMLYQANHDALTGLFNRTEFERKVADALAVTNSTGIRHILVFIDIDQFKLINDSSGHIVGDQLLREFAQTLKEFVGEDGVVARMGGDEFGILYENKIISQVTVELSDLLERIRKDRFEWEDMKYEVTASIGIVEITDEAVDIRQVLAHADIAVYTAKDLGRNRAHIFIDNDVVLAKRHQELTWAASITEALDDDRFNLYYQTILPISDVTKENKMNKVEILVRLVDKDGNEASPGAFIPAAERYNMMGAIDRWVVKHSLEALHQLQFAYGAKSFQFCVNLSGNSLSDPGFLDYVIKTLTYYPVELNSLCFEITETAVISNLSDAMNLISQLKERGILFALDDFGSGLSSFSYLKNLPVDYLKIDGSFVKNMVDDRQDRAMVQAINQVGQVVGMETVAEFVENDEILTELVELGVDYAQGYGVARPEPLIKLMSHYQPVASVDSGKN